ncbi:MAG: hypothetical protein ABIV63_11640 [Caldimonas sp.]
MTSIPPNRMALALGLAWCLGASVAHAQGVRPSAKGVLQVPANPSAMSTIPAGIDGGTPSTSNSVPLGTPTTPANDAERAELRKAAAAARAAARPRRSLAPQPAASGADEASTQTSSGSSVMVQGAANATPGARPTGATASTKGGVDCVAAAAAAGSGVRSRSDRSRASGRTDCP